MTNAVVDIPESGTRSRDPEPEPRGAATQRAHPNVRWGQRVSWSGTQSRAISSVEEAPEETTLYRSLDKGVSILRWLTIAMLLFLTVLQPRMGRIGLENWELVLLFIAYNALMELLLMRLPGQRALYWRVTVDLPAAGAIYFFSATPGAPQFDLIFLAVLCAAISLKLPRSLVYTALAVSMTALIEPTLPFWFSSAQSVRELGARMLLLALAGTGTAIVARRLAIEQQQTNSAREEAQRLEEIDRLRDDFISTITHDLRTPFTAVRAGLGMVEMSVGDRLRPEELHLLSNVRRNGDRLGILINDLLAFTQFEAGAFHLDMQSLDLGDIVASAACDLQPLIAEKSQTLSVGVDTVLPHKGDKRKLEQVVINLLDNAHRHTPPGTHISVTGLLASEEVELVIRDDGPGIPPQECQAIFERFHRVDLKEGGWGLGLTIAQAIIEQHGGRIWVESSLGQGAAFHVALPRYDTTTLDQGSDQ